MSAFPVPRNDAARVGVLHDYQVLDTPPEPAFDELAQLAADICGTPMAMISLIDKDRQWFKAKVGTTSTESPRAYSFCSHAICEPDREIFEIPDALLDERFMANPLVLDDPNIRFYAGTPLVNGDGWALGTLCVIDRQPRELNLVQRRGLSALRRFVINALETRRMVGRQQTAIHELNAARRELEAARQAAEEATRAKGQFLASMSHEIRTPMNAVIGMTSLLGATPLSPEQKEYVETIRSSGELLLAVINDVLDFSKIESGRMEVERERFEVRKCVADALAMLTAAARAKGLALRVQLGAEVPAAVLGDAVRVRQIIVNLLSNAVKFTERGEVTVQVNATVTNGACELHFVVADTGIGISAAQMAKLFQEFGQAEASTTRRFGGSGLGLVISRRLAELHGGRMWVESNPGQGSRFHLTIVAEATAAAPAAAVPAGGIFDASFARRYPARILVVDDIPVNRLVASRMLARLGYAPEMATSGVEALRRLAGGTFDVLLMDVEMPEMDGMTATRKLRAELPASTQPKVVALTAHAMLEHRQRFVEAGMDSYLPKPLRVEDLTAELARLRAGAGGGSL